MLYTIITILAIIVAVLLIAIVLIQNPKGGGLNSIAGGLGQQILGARGSTDVVEKLTWGFASALLLLCFSTAFFVDRNSSSANNPSVQQSEVEKRQKETGGSLPLGAPAATGLGAQPSPGTQPNTPANPQ
ncbi:MAG: preprotein translocase subunit SecG [Chitinophagales bacterium]|nr:preprotein translocase subunit SecG [Chitinophagales bacterium]MDW8419362.1 preprotein translocase subunit SecG [Chitinophagales bacterium]